MTTQEKTKLPVLFRRFYYRDIGKWELFAVFPTLPANSSNWYGMESEAENGESFACSIEYWQQSRHVSNWEPERVAAFVERIKRHWENDSDFPYILVPYARISSRMHDERESHWRKSRG